MPKVPAPAATADLSTPPCRTSGGAPHGPWGRWGGRPRHGGRGRNRHRHLRGPARRTGDSRVLAGVCGGLAAGHRDRRHPPWSGSPSSSWLPGSGGGCTGVRFLPAWLFGSARRGGHQHLCSGRRRSPGHQVGHRHPARSRGRAGWWPAPCADRLRRIVHMAVVPGRVALPFSVWRNAGEREKVMDQ